MNLWNDLPPTDQERESAVADILRVGLPAPHRLFYALRALRRALGWRHIFFGVWDCLFLSLLGSFLCFLALLPGISARDPGVYCVLFLVSPALYAFLHLLTNWKEFMMGTYDRKMTCRFTIHQITVLRMLVFGGVSLGVCVPLSVILWMAMGQMLPLLTLFSISCAALFLFAAAQSLAQSLRRRSARLLAVPAAWCALGLFLLALGEKSTAFFLRMPAAVFLAIAAAAALLFCHTLKRWFFSPQEGVFFHAAS